MALPVIYQLSTMVLLMVVGVILNKRNLLSESNAKGLSIVLTRVAVPANMVILMQRPYSHEILVGSLKTCGGTFLLCSLGALLFYIVGKALGMRFPCMVRKGGYFALRLCLPAMYFCLRFVQYCSPLAAASEKAWDVCSKRRSSI